MRRPRSNRLRSAGPSPKRSGERVLDYLSAEFERPDMKEGSRLPTIQEIATHLHVSVPTVHSVFKRLAGEGRIRSKSGQGSFLVSHPATQKTHRVALTLDFPKTSPSSFTSRLLGGILKRALECQPPVVLSPLTVVESEEAILDELTRKIPSVDGLILFPNRFNDQVRALYEKARKPVVDYNPPRELGTINFVSFDYFGESARLGRAWKRSGRKRIALVLATPISVSVSGRLRRFGLETGLATGYGEDIEVRVVEGMINSPDEGHRLLKALIRESKFTPDAVFCIGDYLALGALKALRECGLIVPNDVSVVGGTGLDLSETAYPTLTRVRQDLEQAGEALVKLLSERLHRKGESLPGEILPTRFIGGATTLPVENEELGIQPSN